MKVQKFSLGSLGAVFAAVLGLVSATTLMAPSQAQAGVSSNVLETAGEVFLKGSIDGKSMFMVLGMKDAKDSVKDIMDWAVDEQDLTDLRDDITNKSHNGDFADAAKDGADLSKEAAQQFFSTPWKSLKEIPKAYRVSFDRAQEAYYGSKNPVAGALKYSGWAVWANIQGAYYLVIEAPVEFVALSVATVGAVPAAIALHGIVIAWDVTKVVVKFTAGVVASAAVATYAFVTSSTATALTLIAGGAVGVFKGGKWLFYGLPYSLFHPVQVENLTGFAFADEQTFANFALEYLKARQASMHLVAVASEIGKYNSRVTLSLSDDSGKAIDAAVLKFSSKKGNVVMSLDATRKYYKLRRQANPEMSRSEVKSMIHGEFMTLLQDIEKAYQDSQESKNPKSPQPETLLSQAG